MTTIAEAIRQARFVIESPSAQLDAQVLLAHVLGKDRSYCYTHADALLTGDQLQAFEQLVEKRAQGYPVAQLIGRKSFWASDFLVNEHTLLPRPETELLVEWCLEHYPDNPGLRVLDLGTGSGAIAISLALERPQWQVTAIDQSDEAIEVAKKNAKTLGADNVAFLLSDWFSVFEHDSMPFDLIVSNPPYIDPADPWLQQGDVRFEPSTALVSADAGFADLTQIIEQARAYLASGGVLLLEHGHQQQAQLIANLLAAGYVDVQGLRDYAGLERMVVARWLM